MFMRIDKLLIELPMPKKQDPNAGAALQELLGGKYGEMSTLNNYMFQSFNFRSKSKLRPFYDIVASITAEEFGHVELVANGVALLNNGPDGDETGGADISGAPFAVDEGHPPRLGFRLGGRRRHARDSDGLPWNGTFVTSTGNVVMDMLFNFHLECGARLHKLRVYETMTEETGREVCGYLLVRGSVHAHAYALVAEEAHRAGDREGPAGAEHQPRAHPGMPQVPRRGPAPLPLHQQPERLPRHGRHLGQRRDRRCRATRPGELEVVDGVPDGGKIPELDGMASAFTPDYAPEEMFEVAQKLYAASR